MGNFCARFKKKNNNRIILFKILFLNSPFDRTFNLIKNLKRKKFNFLLPFFLLPQKASKENSLEISIRCANKWFRIDEYYTFLFYHWNSFAERFIFLSHCHFPISFRGFQELLQFDIRRGIKRNLHFFFPLRFPYILIEFEKVEEDGNRFNFISARSGSSPSSWFDYTSFGIFFISFATRESEQVGKSFFFLFFIYKKQTEGNIK